MAKEIMLFDKRYAFFPSVIELYKGSKLGVRDLRSNIASFMNERNHFVLVNEFESKNFFCAWTCSNLKFCFDNDALVEPKLTSVLEYESRVFPSIVTVAFPWVENKMLTISLFADKQETIREYNFVSNLSEVNKKKWVAAHLADGANFYTERKVFDLLKKCGYFKQFQIQESPIAALLGQHEVHVNSYKSPLNIFDLVINKNMLR